jgi:hypothetical protein
MKYALFLAPLFMIVGCGKRDAALRQKIIGTWELNGGPGFVMNIASDGRVLSKLTERAQVRVDEGTWFLRGDVIEMSTTNSNSVPTRGHVIHIQVIRADGHELTYQHNGEVLSFSRIQ